MFEYLAKKVTDAPFLRDPFKHIYLENFFSDDHFKEIIQQREISIEKAETDLDLLDKMQNAGYEIIDFPGTTTDFDAYMEWHRNKRFDTAFDKGMTDKNLCEGLGVTLRLKSVKSDIIEALAAFLRSDLWLQAISAKFEIDVTQVRADGGIQKYLDGYEISPHPDIRMKALTYMVNINPTEHSSEINYHTHYMRFRADKIYVQEFWAGNKDLDRCWVPWSWCETVKTQAINNSIVLFQPADDTVHAVRAHYEHLETQRTQLYGNLWYLESKTVGKPTWTDFDLRARLASN